MQKLFRFFKTLGPGVITGASDDDPTAIATYAQSGAQFGYHQLWTTLFTLPFMIVIQEMSARIGIASGKGIAAIITKHYSKYIIYFTLLLLLIANSINIGADIGAVAVSIQLLWHLPTLVYLLLVTITILGVQILVGYKQFSTILKYTTLVLLAYVGVALVTKQHWGEIFSSTIIPYISFKKDYLLNLVAIFGTNVSPYLFFWQASEEVEDQVESGKQKKANVGKPRTGKKDITSMRIDTIIGMTFSNLVLFFLEIAAAVTLGFHGITSVDTPAKVAESLKPIAGNLSFILFTVGILGSGFLAIPVLSTSCAYAVAETFNKEATLEKGFMKEKTFYLLIIGVTVIGLLINFFPVKPFTLLIYSAAVNGILTPFLIIVLLVIANNKTIMRGYTNSKFSNYISILLATIMTISSVVLIFSMGKM